MLNGECDVLSESTVHVFAQVCLSFFKVVLFIYLFKQCLKRMTQLAINNYSITKTYLFKYIEVFTSKNSKISDRKPDIFHISAQNIDCGYSLEPPRRGGSNVYPQSMLFSKIRKLEK